MSGFSLIESLVMISIITILTSISVAALPAVRAHQALVSDTEQIRSLLLDSKQRALNQVRPEACVRQAESEGKDPRRCSDVGIVFTGGNVVQYADIQPNFRYDADKKDYVFATYEMQSVLVNSLSINHFLFYGNPPSVDLVADGRRVEPGETKGVVLEFGTGEDRQRRAVEVSSFGTIEIKPL